MAYMDVPPLGTPNGKSVILLHGMNFFGEVWTDTIELLRKEGYRVIPIDQIGYGRSSKPILHYTISTHASNTKRLLDHLGIKVTDIVTHSMGGMVASRFASLYPDSVGNLAMINQIGLTDIRHGRPALDITEIYKSELARDYPEIVKGMRAYYVNWKPEYMKYVKIHYGWTRSGDWPRMAMVRALQMQAIVNDPVVYDWAVEYGGVIVGEGWLRMAGTRIVFDSATGAPRHQAPYLHPPDSRRGRRVELATAESGRWCRSNLTDSKGCAKNRPCRDKPDWMLLGPSIM